MLTIDQETLIEEYGGIVHSITRRMIQDPDKARDAVQEVWYEILKSLPSFQGKSKLSTWIYKITTRVVLNFAKTEQIYSSRFINSFFTLNSSAYPVVYFYGLHEKCNIDEKLWIKERCSKCLTGLLHCLKNDARLILLYHDLAELSFIEVSEIMGKEEENIRQIASRSRQKVRNFLDDHCTLYNPDGNCSCHLKKPVLKTNLPLEYQRLRETVRKMNVFKAFDRFLPPKNLWEIAPKNCHKFG